jgi:preprotein translocase subunit SecE
LRVCIWDVNAKKRWMLDKIKLGLSVLIIGVGISGFYLLAESPQVVRVAAFMLALVFAALVAWTSVPGKVFVVYARESVIETRKVVWPTRKETMQSTGLVLAFVFVMAVFLWGVDSILASLIRLLLGTET